MGGNAARKVRITAMVQIVAEDAKTLQAIIAALKELGVTHFEISCMESNGGQEQSARQGESIEGAIRFLQGG